MKTIRSIILLAAGLALALSCRKERMPEWHQGFYPTSRVPVKAVPHLDEGWEPLSRSASDITAIDVSNTGANYQTDSGIIGLVYNLNPSVTGNTIGSASGSTICGKVSPDLRHTAFATSIETSASSSLLCMT